MTNHGWLPILAQRLTRHMVRWIRIRLFMGASCTEDGEIWSQEKYEWSLFFYFIWHSCLLISICVKRRYNSFFFRPRRYNSWKNIWFTVQICLCCLQTDRTTYPKQWGSKNLLDKTITWKKKGSTRTCHFFWRNLRRNNWVSS